jgi:hypothetical protein
VVYANAHSRINSLYHFSLFESICLFYKTSLLPYNHFQIGGGMIAFYGCALLNKNTVWPMPLFLFLNTQTMRVQSITRNSIAMLH